MLKKIKRIFTLLFMIASIFTISTYLISCDNSNVVESGFNVDNVVFNDETFKYDGKEHSIKCDESTLPEGAKVQYLGNGVKKPGVYTVTAKIKYDGQVYEKTATLTIEKLESKISAPEYQEYFIYGNIGKINVEYTLENNDSNQIVEIIVKDNGEEYGPEHLYNVGEYDVEVYIKESLYYKESNHVNIKFVVKQSNFNLSYDSQYFTYDNTQKELLLTGDIPSGYTVEYENNKGTEQGKYYAKAYIKNSSNEVVETHAAVLTIENPENEEFAQYLDDFLVLYIEGDQLSSNIFFENPEDFGLEHYDAYWYTYDGISDSDIELAIEDFNELKAELEKYKEENLNFIQEVAYRKIEGFLDYYINYYSIEDVNYMQVLYVDSFGGYVADFGTYMEAYTFRNEQDVMDVISFINSTRDAFPSYVQFVADKAEAGYPLNDTTIKEMTKYLDEVLSTRNSYYLTDVLSVKIDKLDFLTDEQKSSYKSQISDGMINNFMVGVEELKNGIQNYLGLCSEDKDGYWAEYEHGQELFFLELGDLLGMDNLNPISYASELETTLKQTSKDASNALNTLIKKYSISSNDQLQKLIDSYVIYDGTPEEMLEFLYEFAKTIVPDLEVKPNITVKEMDLASAAVSNAVAYYMKSPLDSFDEEYITLNPLKLKYKNDVLGTLSHEGYPGHLYAYVHCKQLDIPNLLKIFTSTAHAEGWATYVELKLYEYAINNSTDADYKTVMKYLYASQLSSFLLETRIDIGIHYNGWDVKKVGEFLGNQGYSSDSAKEIYDLLIETPTSYAAYGYGKLTFYNLHVKAQELLGALYDEIEFNTMLLSRGWSTLDELYNTYNEYMNDKCHIYGINR